MFVNKKPLCCLFEWPEVFLIVLFVLKSPCIIGAMQGLVLSPFHVRKASQPLTRYQHINVGLPMPAFFFIQFKNPHITVSNQYRGGLGAGPHFKKVGRGCARQLSGGFVFFGELLHSGFGVRGGGLRMLCVVVLWHWLQVEECAVVVSGHVFIEEAVEYFGEVAVRAGFHMFEGECARDDFAAAVKSALPVAFLVCVHRVSAR